MGKLKKTDLVGIVSSSPCSDPFFLDLECDSWSSSNILPEEDGVERKKDSESLLMSFK